MLIRWLNDDQSLEQAEPCWSPRGTPCSPSSWESVQTRSKQIVRRINNRGSGRSSVRRSEEAGVRGTWRGVHRKPGGALKANLREVVCLLPSCVQTWRKVKLRLRLLRSTRLRVRETPREDTETSEDPWAVAWWCVVSEDLTSAHLGFKGTRIFFLVSKQLPCAAFVRYLWFHLLLHADPEDSHRASTSGARAALGICATSLILSTNLNISFEFQKRPLSKTS